MRRPKALEGGQTARQPKQPPVLFDQTQEILRRIEDKAGMPMFCYWNSHRGSVCDNDVLAVYEVFSRAGRQDRAGLFIKSNGGEVESALRIVHLIREYCGRLVAMVPLECASAATMISLGADEIHMGPLAHLTAVDSSLRHDLSPIDETENRRVSVSQDELLRLVSLWNDNARDNHGNPFTDIFQYIHPLVIGAIDRSSSLSIKVCQEILGYHIDDPEECARISNHLNSDYPSHSYPITNREASRIGLNVMRLDPAINDLLLDLSEIYSEMAQPSLTDFDEYNYHDNEILNIVEARDYQTYYQNDQDWSYIKEERRWQSMNDESCWRKTEMVDGRKTAGKLHIR